MTHWTGKIARVVAISLLVGCQAAPLASGGALSFRFQYDNHQSTQFQIKAIPAGSQKIEVEISGEGLAAARKESFNLNSGTSTQTQTIKDLPSGPKQVTVKAISGDDVMASGSTNVEIKVGQTAKADLELKALKAASTVELEQVLPLNINLNASISGEGLDKAIERTATIESNQLSASLGNLPLGKKEIELTVSTLLGTQKITTPPFKLAFDVTAEGGTLKVGIQSIIKAKNFEDNLESLVLAADPLVLVGWINTIRSNPAKLKELFFLLPQSVQDRLRLNPLVSPYLPAPEEAPAPSPEPSASTEPLPSPEASVSPSPEVSASPVVEAESLFADVRLALQEPNRPLLLMLAPPEDILGRIRVLRPSEVINIEANTVWGLLIRSSYTGTMEVPFSASLKEVGGTDPTNNRSWNTGLRQKFTLNDTGFTGDIVPFKNDSTLVNVPAGTYNLIVSLKHPETGISESKAYTIQAN